MKIYEFILFFITICITVFNYYDLLDEKQYISEKKSQNMEDNSIDKKSLSDNLNKIFNSGSFKSNNEENTNNINIQIMKIILVIKIIKIIKNTLQKIIILFF